MTPLSDGAVARLQRSLRVAADAPDADLPPDLTGTRYELGERIGRGGMGAVYAARDTALDRAVALKVLDAALADTDAARLAREARILARLEHPGIVPVHDVGTLADGRVFYTMKRVRGLRLDEHVRALDAERTRAERLRLFARICDAVAFAHAHGVVHRDLKPENVMVGAFGEVLVLDWGIAKLLGAGDEPAADAPRTGGAHEGTQPGMVLGTPGYMAPEQARGESASADERSDVYALGGVLRFLLTGSGPRDGGDDGALPRPLRSVCRTALDPDPARRYASVAALAADVARFEEGERVLAHRESVVERLGRWVERYRTPIALVAAYLIMRLLLIVFGRA